MAAAGRTAVVVIKVVGTGAAGAAAGSCAGAGAAAFSSLLDASFSPAGGLSVLPPPVLPAASAEGPALADAITLLLGAESSVPEQLDSQMILVNDPVTTVTLRMTSHLKSKSPVVGTSVIDDPLPTMPKLGLGVVGNESCNVNPVGM